MDNTTQQRFAAAQIIPVIVIDRLEDALPMAEALVTAGLDVLEVTLRTPAGIQAVERLAKSLPGALVGVGTAINDDQLQAASDHGARFAVSPGFTESLASKAAAIDLPLLPGVGNASDMIRALKCDLNFVKFFPAETLGGVSALKAYGGPFPQLKFCPTGGVSEALAPEYLALPNVVCVGGSWILPSSAINSGDWGQIETLAKQAKQKLSA